MITIQKLKKENENLRKVIKGFLEREFVQEEILFIERKINLLIDNEINQEELCNI